MPKHSRNAPPENIQTESWLIRKGARDLQARHGFIPSLSAPVDLSVLKTAIETGETEAAERIAGELVTLLCKAWIGVPSREPEKQQFLSTSRYYAYETAEQLRKLIPAIRGRLAHIVAVPRPYTSADFLIRCNFCGQMIAAGEIGKTHGRRLCAPRSTEG